MNATSNILVNFTAIVIALAFSTAMIGMVIESYFRDKVKSSTNETVKILFIKPFRASNKSGYSVGYLLSNGESKVYEVNEVTVKPGKAEANLEILEYCRGDNSSCLTEIHAPYLPYESSKCINMLEA